MPKKLNLDEYIQKTLEKGPQSIEDIIKQARDDPEFKAPRKKESYYEAINKLNKSGSIQIENYEVPDSGRLQKIDTANLIFSLVKSDPLDIRKLVRESEDDDIEKAKNAHKELKSLFAKKIRQINCELLGLKPSMSNNELETLFEDILYYVLSQVPRDPPMRKLSRALSDDVKSTELLEEIILDAKNKTAFTKF